MCLIESAWGVGLVSLAELTQLSVWLTLAAESASIMVFVQQLVTPLLGSISSFKVLELIPIQLQGLIFHKSHCPQAATVGWPQDQLGACNWLRCSKAVPVAEPSWLASADGGCQVLIWRQLKAGLCPGQAERSRVTFACLGIQAGTVRQWGGEQRGKARNWYKSFELRKNT